MIPSVAIQVVACLTAGLKRAPLLSWSGLVWYGNGGGVCTSDLACVRDPIRSSVPVWLAWRNSTLFSASSLLKFRWRPGAIGSWNNLSDGSCEQRNRKEKSVCGARGLELGAAIIISHGGGGIA